MATQGSERDPATLISPCQGSVRSTTRERQRGPGEHPGAVTCALRGHRQRTRELRSRRRSDGIPLDRRQKGWTSAPWPRRGARSTGTSARRRRGGRTHDREEDDVAAVRRSHASAGGAHRGEAISFTEMGGPPAAPESIAVIASAQGGIGGKPVRRTCPAPRGHIHRNLVHHSPPPVPGVVRARSSVSVPRAAERGFAGGREAVA